MHSVSIMTAFSEEKKKLIPLNLVGIIYSTFIESDYFLWVKKTTMQFYQKVKF